MLRNGDRIFPAMLAAVDGAQRSVDLMTYVYWKGEIAQRFANAMSAAARRGVRVRLLIDAVGGLQIEKGLVDGWTRPACTSSGSASRGSTPR